MFLLFALALTVSQIHTGDDLIAACRADDTSACDAFIEQALAGDDVQVCVKDASKAQLRRAVLERGKAQPAEFQRHPKSIVLLSVSAQFCPPFEDSSD